MIPTPHGLARAGGFLLKGLAMTLKEEMAVQGEKINNIEKSCIEIKTCLLGNGKPGLVVRTDRLEQRDKFQSKVFWLMFSTTSAVAIKVLADVIGFNTP